MQRAIDGPEQVWSTVEQAAAWLGLDVREFRAEVSRCPHLLPPSTRHKRHRWHWMDLVCYAHLAHRLPAERLPENNSKEISEKSNRVQ